jgi:tetratricopeptide (TPR) repeat protein
MLDLDRAAACLERADQLRFLVNVPLSLDVLDQYSDLIKSRGAYQKPTLGREVEYNWIYDHAAYDELNLTFIKANYYHRLGDVANALNYVDLLEPVLENLPDYLNTIIGIDEVFWIIAILRDGKHYDDALRLLDSLQTYAEGIGRSFDIFYMRGLIHDTKGESNLAIEAYEKAHSLIEQRSRPIGIAPYVQYIAALLNAGRDLDALQALRKIDIQRDANSDRDRLFYYTVAAYVYETHSEYSEGLQAIEKATAIVEERRAEILDPVSRRAWQGQQENLFAIAVKLYDVTGKPQQAWRAIELSKARTLLDELEGRGLLSPEHTALIIDLDTITRATHITEREINRDMTNEVSAVLRTEAVADLAQLLQARFRDILDSTPFEERDFPTLLEILAERWNEIDRQEQRMREATSTPAGRVIDLDEVGHLLED